MWMKIDSNYKGIQSKLKESIALKVELVCGVWIPAKAIMLPFMQIPFERYV